MSFADHRIPLPAGSPLAGLDRRVILGLRPTGFELAGPGTDPALPRLWAKVDVVEKLGSESHLIFSVDAPRVSTDAVRAAHDADSPDEGVLLADDQGAHRRPPRRASRRRGGGTGRGRARGGRRLSLRRGEGSECPGAPSWPPVLRSPPGWR